MKFPRKVYILRHEATGKIYVGSAADVLLRYKSHRSKLKHGRHNSTNLQKDYDSHEDKSLSIVVIDSIAGISEKAKEYEWMDLLRTYDPAVGYNGNDHHFRHRRP